MPQKKTFDDLCAFYLRKQKLENGYEHYVNQVNICGHLLETYKGRLIKSVVADSFLADHAPNFRSRHPGKKLEKHLMTFNAMMGLAYSRRWIKWPIAKIKYKEPKKIIGKELSNTEMLSLIEQATKNGNPRLALQLKIGFSTGMRRGEILKLKWSYIDFVNKAISLPAELMKNRKARMFPVGDELIQEFKKFANNSVYVFPGRFSNKKHQVSIKTGFNSARRKSGIWVRFHDSRHTAITRKIRKTKRIDLVEKYMSVSKKVLLDVYNHVSTEDLKECVETIGHDVA